MNLGLIDSGLGGIGILKTLHLKYPTANIICLADQKNAPYGNRSALELIEISKKNVQWMIDRGIRDILLACNTTSSIALEILREQFPYCKIQGIIDITCQQLMGTNYPRVLILATQVTVESASYLRTLKAIIPQSKLNQIALIELAGLIEDNASSQSIDELLIKYLSPYVYEVDAIVLGCTHYPLVKSKIKEIINVPIFDSDLAVCENISMNDITKASLLEVYTTKNAYELSEQIHKLYNFKCDVQKVTV